VVGENSEFDTTRQERGRGGFQTNGGKCLEHLRGKGRFFFDFPDMVLKCKRGEINKKRDGKNPAMEGKT